MIRTRPWWLILTLVPVLMGACGNDDQTTQPTPGTDLATALVTAAELGDRWSVPNFPDGDLGSVDGAVSDSQHDDLPRPELCEQASEVSRTAVDNIRWTAFRALELEVDNPIQPPADRSGHMVFLQELLTTDPVSGVRTTFELLKQGYEACLGDIPSDEEGPGRAEPMPSPEVGDDRFATLLTFEEAGGWAQWRIHQIMVIQGPVLMSLMIGEIRSMDVEPLLDFEEVGRLARIAAEALTRQP
jgi:hypothetical protein